MALVLKDRVKETTTTTGTGTYTLAGAVAGFEAFSEIGDGNTTYYACTDGTDFEVGIGTYTASGTTLARTTILQSSNSDNAVNWSSGSRTIFCTQPAEKAVFLDGSGNISIPGTIDGRDLATDGSKLDGIEASADVTDTANVTAAGALMDSEVTNLAQVKAFDSSDYATAAQGTTADSAMQDLSDDTSPTLGGALSTGGNQIQLSQTSGIAIETTGNLGNADLTLLSANSGTSGQHGFDIIYKGTRSGNANSFALNMHNQVGTDVEAITVYQDGKVGINNTAPTAPLDVTGNIVVSGTVDGRDLATDGAKLDGIESGATADQTAAEIRTLVESASDSNVFTDADHTKLNGIEANADVTDTANVTAAGALMDSEVTNLAQVKAFDSSDYATAAQGSTADAAMPKAGGTFTGNVDFDGGDVTFHGTAYDAKWTNSVGNFTFYDNTQVFFGDSNDLIIQHTGTETQFANSTGPLVFGQTSGERVQFQTATELMARWYPDAQCELYYDGSKKFETTSTGIDVTGDVTVDNTATGSSTTAHIDLKRTLNSGGTDTDYTYRLLHATNNGYARLGDTGVPISDIGGANDSLPTLAWFYGDSSSANFGFPLSNIPININVNNTTNGGVLKGDSFGFGDLIFGTTTNASTSNLKLQTNGADAVVIAADKDALFYGDIEIDGGANSDWAFNVDSNGDLIIKVGGTAKAKLDTNGNLTCVGNVTAYGTI